MQLSTTEMVFVLGATILILLALWLIPKWQVRPLNALPENERFKIENEARKVLAEIFGGTFVLIGLFFTWQTIKSTGENLRISGETLRVTQEGQVTDRFTKAIEQLGKEDETGKPSNLAIRLGGIRGLERLAGDSEKDYWPIVEVLSTYIRQHVVWKEVKRNDALDQVLPPEPDIQAILSVLGRRKRSYKDGEMQRLDLSGTDLRRATLNEGNFKGADFTKAHLEGARLKEAHLEGANFTAANLSGAILEQAHLEEANLTGAILDKAVLTGANLKGVIGLTPEQIKSVIMDSKTQLPAGLTP